MKALRVLVISRNLIGDSLYIRPTVMKFLELNPTAELDLLTMHGHAEDIYLGLGIQWRKIFYSDEECKADPYDGGVYDTKLIFEAGKAGALAEKTGKHIAQCYGLLNGLELEFPLVETPFGKFPAIKPFFDPKEAMRSASNREVATVMLKEDYFGSRLELFVLWSPFSLSCTSQEKDETGKLKGKPPNKMLYPDMWSESIAGGHSAIEFMRGIGPLRLLGSKNEDVPPQWELTLEETETLGLPIPETALLMQQSELVVTVDNGMGHLAASQDANHLLLFPVCLSPSFIIPWGANWTVPAQVDPTTLELGHLLHMLNRSYMGLRRMRKQQQTKQAVPVL